MSTINTNREANMIRVTAPDGSQRIAGVWRGQKSGRLHEVVRDTVNATESLARAVYDIRGNRNFGPVEAGTRLRQATAPTLKQVNDAAVKIRAEKTALREQMRQLNPAKTYEASGHWQAQFDLRMIDWFNALPTGQRAAVEHELRTEPLMRLELAEALLRTPRELSSLPEQVRAEMRLGLIERTRTVAFEALDEKLEQLTVAENAMSLAVEKIREAGSVDDVIQHAPEAFKYLTHDADKTRLTWLPPAEPTQADTVTP
jgi:hypothetical protein